MPTYKLDILNRLMLNETIKFVIYPFVDGFICHVLALASVSTYDETCIFSKAFVTIRQCDKTKNESTNFWIAYSEQDIARCLGVDSTIDDFNGMKYIESKHNLTYSTSLNKLL